MEAKENQFSDKWTLEIEQYGFTQVPDLLLTCQEHFDLKDGELLTLIHLLSYWYYKNGIVWPAISTLASNFGKKYSTVQRRLMNLEKKGFIERVERPGTSNIYDIEPCVRKLYQHQLHCPYITIKRGDLSSKATRVPTSFLGDKEEELLRKLTKETLGNSSRTSTGTFANIVIAGEVSHE
jgi:DNA-binding MarR family transcriptional regulator